ncbi:unnamed protein product [Amoebophrya sp. A25]|nr:unnamed protein product [Amoebophrya sp. A25]|eukprot:GSA25T00018799001.1
MRRSVGSLIGTSMPRAEALRSPIQSEHRAADHMPSPLTLKWMKEATRHARGDECEALKIEQRRRSVGDHDFWRLRSLGPKMKGRETHVERYRCRICKVSYATSWQKRQE